MLILKYKYLLLLLFIFLFNHIYCCCYDFDIVKESINDAVNNKNNILNYYEKLVIVDSIYIGKYFFDDLAWDGKFLWVLISSPYDNDSIFKVNVSNGQIIDSFKIDSSRDATRLTWDSVSAGGPYLWCGDLNDSTDMFDNTSRILKIRIKDYKTVDIYKSPDIVPAGLEWYNNFIWINGFFKGKIIKLNPLTRDFENLFSTSDYECRGDIAISEFVTDNPLLWLLSFNEFILVDTLILRDLLSGQIISKFLTPCKGNFGLCFDNNSAGGPFFWFANDQSKMIYKIKVPNIVNVNEKLSNNLIGVICSPNPFIQKTTIQFYLYHPEKINLTIYNLLGYKLAILADEYLSEGQHEFTFDGSALPSATYYYVLQANGKVETGKLVLIK